MELLTAEHVNFRIHAMQLYLERHPKSSSIVACKWVDTIYPNDWEAAIKFLGFDDDYDTLKLCHDKRLFVIGYNFDPYEDTPEVNKKIGKGYLERKLGKLTSDKGMGILPLIQESEKSVIDFEKYGKYLRNCMFFGVDPTTKWVYCMDYIY